MYLVTNHGTRESWRVSDFRAARDIAVDQRAPGKDWHWDPDRLCWWAKGEQPITIGLRTD